MDRISTLYNWVASQWPTLPRPATPLTGLSYTDREKIDWFQSKALGAKRGYGIFVPPGYELEVNAAARYPVLYLLHGYEGDPNQILPSTLLADAYMGDADVQLRPMIVVTPSGACCFVQRGTLARDCREADDNGVSLTGRPDWDRECLGGNFFVNQTGATQYEDSLFELMDEVDSKYRTLPPADLERR